MKVRHKAYLRRDPSTVDRIPRTINRICGQLYEMGLKKIYERESKPKETNRQIGPMFRRWLREKSLELVPVDLREFLSNGNDEILDASDQVMLESEKNNLGYKHKNGLILLQDFIKNYII